MTRLWLKAGAKSLRWRRCAGWTAVRTLSPTSGRRLPRSSVLRSTSPACCTINSYASCGVSTKKLVEFTNGEISPPAASSTTRSTGRRTMRRRRAAARHAAIRGKGRRSWATETIAHDSLSLLGRPSVQQLATSIIRTSMLLLSACQSHLIGTLLNTQIEIQGLPAGNGVQQCLERRVRGVQPSLPAALCVFPGTVLNHLCDLQCHAVRVGERVAE